jgi:hypothetical protein
MSTGRPRQRLHIERLDLDLRGIAPETAQAIADALGPALARQFAQAPRSAQPAPHVDAGRLTSAASPDPAALAGRIARRIVARSSGET